MKRLYYLFVLLALLWSNKSFAYDIAVENADGVTIYYNYINDGKELEVVGNDNSLCYSGNIIIPEDVTFMNRTRKVTSIGKNAFWHSSIQSVQIPSSISRICSYAFVDCKKLLSIDIPSGVIERNAINCSALEKVCLGDEVTELKEGAIVSNNLTTILIGKSLKSIGKNALGGNLKKVVVKDIAAWCSVDIDSESGLPYPLQLYSDENTPITNLVIPEGVKTIKKGVFGGKNANYDNYEKIYDSVTFPTSIETISYYNNECLFRNIKVIIKDVAAWCNVGITHYYQMDYSMYSEDGSPIKHLVIPEGITELNGDNFAYCNTLESVSFSQSMKTIQGFKGCKKLSRIDMKEGVKDIGQDAFYGCSISNLRIPSTVEKIGYQAFGYNNISTVVSLIEKPFGITKYDFSNNTLFNATLYVPVGTIDLYKSAEGWKEFMFIEEGIPQEKYKLSYVVDGVEYKTYILEYGETITPEEEPTKEGYTFSGWSDIPKTMPAEDVTVTGTFTINKYKLTYIIDGEEYKTYEVEYGAKITPEPSPTKEGYTFSGWNDIPETMPAKDVIITGTFTMNILGKCAIPSISYNNGKLIFKCETKDVIFKSTITDNDINSYTDNEIKLGVTYCISVYATKTGYEDSETATATLCWIDAEPKTEGISNNVAQVRARAVMIQSNGNVLSVSGADEGTEINVFDTAGRKVGSGRATSNVTNIFTTLNSGEIGIVKIGEKVIKVLMK